MAKLLRTVLIVATDPEDSATIQRTLERDPATAYSCFIATTSNTARAFCSTTTPDALVLDSALPGGLALLAELVGAYGNLAFAIIVLAADDDPALGARALELGAHELMVKHH